ncbi:DUF413 domain-containing protein [Litoribrevibacter euphylliae]|uniref:Macrodomain Ori protein n=1 Tax=Litoribrevibacter euphylliae TaxID=1834034 RepID=A0ABV7HHQ0_9GAMM
MNKDSFLSERNFYDSQHFPNGFAREGVFSLKESEILNDCGYVISQLNSGAQRPENEDQQEMLAFLQGMKDAESTIEKAWQKYQNHIHKQYIAMRALYTDTGGSYQESDSGDF